jgi:hypothetical protein
LILRRTFKQLSLPGAIMARSKQWLRPHPEVHWSDDDKTWTFPSGATLTFGFLEHPDDIYRYQGPEFQYIAFDELTQFNETQYAYMFSRLRRHVDVDVPVRMRAASNPGGVGHIWVRDRFGIPSGPAARPLRAGPSRVFIPAKISDNPGLDEPEYRESLAELSEALRDQLMDGDWGAFEGAAFTITEDHLIDRFDLLDGYEKFEAADYGLNGAPWALCAVDYEGNVVFHDMLYEHDLLPSDLAALVVEKRKAEWGNGHPAFMDPSVWHRTGARNKWGAPAMLADEFTDNGVSVIPANNDPRAGLIRVRELLELDPEHPFPNWHPRAGQPGSPRVFFHRVSCGQLVEELRSAPLQPIDKPDGGEKIDPTWESRYGHACAMTRYAVMTRPQPSKEPEPVPDDEREAMARRMLERVTSRSEAQWI